MRVTSTINEVIIAERPNQGFLQIKEAGFYNVYFNLDLICPARVIRTLGNPNFKSNFSSRAIEDPLTLLRRRLFLLILEEQI